ncbi:DegT/DnrJ/EryC1/StrS family aminotransferase [Thalassomonas actiniarum]|uniref:DegT/DnrJ/EryC1/StrS family aminotransferase n=1 Tax=Thalassomonas actiniarum TaxID=485447 RepID=A0AAE9YQC8_9GAMM|nr:DegT/DnrJ/EryC1/StrS family aminotransferase [Thalassomonas actiniarum]WDD99275.1 DegT/DnrJ/EryC1/StrS family aminotransferase [Thalassomonas actiniarum]
MIPLNKPYLPDQNRYQQYLQTAFDSQRLTNDGPLVQQLKAALEQYLGVKYLLPVVNGTMALQLAYKTFNLKGNAVTTPYSFIATSSSLQWLNIHPNFADIETKSLNLCPDKALAAINRETSALVPVHVYGNPCDVEAFERIKAKTKVKLIYDASHAFGIKLGERSILSYGDASTLSFHATKLFHCVEGGAVIFNKEKDYRRAARMINFGIAPENGHISGPGINGKMSELHAAMGLALLGDIDNILARRNQLFDYYKTLLCPYFEFPLWHHEASQNAIYFPVIFKSAADCNQAFLTLKKQGIGSRRYFSPSLNTLTDTFSGQSVSCPVSEGYAQRLLCLPLYFDLTEEEVEEVCSTLINSLALKQENR